MGLLDSLILFAYLSLMLGLGVVAHRRQQGVEDYYVAGRRMGTLTIACLWMAGWVGGASVVGVASRAYDVGVSAGWYVAAMAIGCGLFGLLMARRVKALGDTHGHLTYPDVMEQGFDARTRLVATITTVLAFVAYSAGQMVAASAILEVLLGWSYGWSLLLTGTIVIAYTASGGYLAVTYTDWVQLVLLMVGVVLVGIPVAIGAAGHWSDLRAALPAGHFDLAGGGWGGNLALVLSIVLSFFVAMDSYSRCFAARDGRSARNGALLAVAFILPLAVAATWLGLAAATLYPDASGSNGILTRFVLDYFPVGLRGLVLVGILAAIMSTADICILSASANYTRDIHQRFLQPGISPHSLLRLGTWASVGMGVVAMAIAWRMQDIIGVLQLGFTINAAALFLPTLFVMFRPGLSPSAAFWSIATSLVTVIAWRIAAGLDWQPAVAIDPLWPGLAVSAAVLSVFGRRGGTAEVAAP